ncbi:hypothetical protein ACTI_79280 [Actinoplanes sp. OR16]|uniref:hypothetical protein n=1 Tax=Actinoplanes sp. OR16 TaxID=946334 RepID=UPI000F6F12B8|nr:hypothetical protein [Actinoplanes sp. OR16]BBH71243.1 hypothetical protein ACTI_79280 [Actinoplanes sp. OR16]
MVTPAASSEPTGSLTPAFQEPGAQAPISASSVPLVVVDGANVVGSVPDGWWRDRAGAAIRLRDALAATPTSGLPDLDPPVEVVLVVEGKARDIPQSPGGVTISRARASGDDQIVDVVRSQPPGRRVVVVTADRGLRERVVALGAEVRGPSSVPR